LEVAGLEAGGTQEFGKQIQVAPPDGVKYSGLAPLVSAERHSGPQQHRRPAGFLPQTRWNQLRLGLPNNGILQGSSAVRVMYWFFKILVFVTMSYYDK